MLSLAKDASDKVGPALDRLRQIRKQPSEQSPLINGDYPLLMSLWLSDAKSQQVTQFHLKKSSVRGFVRFYQELLIKWCIPHWCGYTPMTQVVMGMEFVLMRYRQAADLAPNTPSSYRNV
jgi:hypothetical protein